MKERIYNSSGMLSDEDIKNYFGKEINIFTSEKGSFAFNIDDQLQLGSIDLRFRHEYKKIKLPKGKILDYSMLKKHNYTELFELSDDEKLIINPGEIILTTTLETVQLSEKIAGIITGRSSIARLGVMVHCCQEFINPGHGQPIPLQIINLGPYPVELELKTPICQLILFELKTPSSGKYVHKNDAKYKNEIISETSKIYEEYSENISSQTTQIKERLVNMKIIWKFLENYILPFLPSIIMLLIITPFINRFIGDSTVYNIIYDIKNIPLLIIIGIFALIMYIIIIKHSKED